MTSAYAGASPGAPAPGYGPGYGPMGGPPAASSGMLGTGIAAAGGFAAGMLAEKLLDGRHERDMPSAAAAGSGGLMPGMFDDAPGPNEAADELEQRSVDFGSGDDWGGSSDRWRQRRLVTSAYGERLRSRRAAPIAQAILLLANSPMIPTRRHPW
jgi:hypothetical protein